MAKAKLVKRKKVANLNKKFMLSAAKVIAQQIVEKKSSNNGRAPWGFASQLLKQGREIYPKLSMRTINNYILKLENEMKEKTIGRTILVHPIVPPPLNQLMMCHSIASQKMSLQIY